MKPDTDSKNASVKLKSSDNMNGTVPSKLIAVHINPTIKKPSRLRIACESCLNGSQSTRPMTNASANVIEKCCTSPSL